MLECRFNKTTHDCNVKGPCGGCCRLSNTTIPSSFLFFQKFYKIVLFKLSDSRIRLLNTITQDGIIVDCDERTPCPGQHVHAMPLLPLSSRPAPHARLTHCASLTCPLPLSAHQLFAIDRRTWRKKGMGAGRKSLQGIYYQRNLQEDRDCCNGHLRHRVVALTLPALS